MSASSTVLPEKATHQQTRTFNQQLVLRALHDHSPLSRADLARLTGLTRTSVGDLVGTLIDDGLIEEVGRGRSSGGKSPILLRVAPDGRHLIGLDLGEAQFSGAVVNLRGEILRSIHLPLEGRDGDAAVELVFELVDALRADDRSPLLGIGIGAPGIIDTSTGTVRWSVNLNWAELRLGPALEERYGVPVVVANDSHAAALAELTFFRRPRPNNLIVIRVGRGSRRRDHPQRPAVPGRWLRRRRVRPRLDGPRRGAVPLREGGLPRDDREHAGVGRRRRRRRAFDHGRGRPRRRLPGRRRRHPADRPRCRARSSGSRSAG